jgi:DNA-binding response OmpR family regulator
MFILIVDNERDVLSVLKRGLKKAGYQIKRLHTAARIDREDLDFIRS